MSLVDILVRHRIWWIFALSILIIFLLVQFALPLVVRHYANAKINSYPGLAGEIGSVKLYFIPGKYLLQNVRLLHTEDEEREILKLDELGVRIYWTSLLKGTIEGDAWVYSPQLSIWAPKPEKEEKETKKKAKELKEANWQTQIRDLIPIKINKFEIRDGLVNYIDPYSKPKIDLKIENIELEASNLTNRDELKDAMFAKTSARAKVFDSGEAELSMQLDPLAKFPTFNLESALKNVDLIKLNDLLMAYGKFDVDRGEFSLFTEIAAKNGKFVAYAKPIFRHIDVRAWEAKHHPNNKLLVLWKNIVGFIVDVLKNEEKDQIATKIKAEGKFEDPDISVWESVGTLLRNGFIQALVPGYDKSISWSDIEDEKPK